jgi:hypothetical protein
MDPISITAGVLSIIKAISTVNHTVRWIISLGNVPTEFLDLQNEVKLRDLR